MKLKIQEFELFARLQNIKPNKLLRNLGSGKVTYKQIKRGAGIGYELVKNIYNKYGAKVTQKVIDFEGGTLSGFKAKFIEVGGKLF